MNCQTNEINQYERNLKTEEYLRVELMQYGLQIWLKCNPSLEVTVFRAVALKTKTGLEVTKALPGLWRKQPSPQKLWTDKGGEEFYNKQMKELLEKNNVDLYPTENEEKSSVKYDYTWRSNGHNRRNNPLLLLANVRAIIIGKSNCGKTTLLLNLLLQPEWLDYNHLCVWSKPTPTRISNIEKRT